MTEDHTANMDQAERAYEDMATMYAGFYHKLRARGLSRTATLVLCAVHFKANPVFGERKDLD